MEKDNEEDCRKKLVAFFYPFIGNVELGNISASEATHALVDAFIHYNNQGWFMALKVKDYQSKNSIVNDEPLQKRGRSDMKIEELISVGREEALILKSLPPEEEARLLGVLKDCIDERFRALEKELRRSLLDASESC